MLKRNNLYLFAYFLLSLFLIACNPVENSDNFPPTLMTSSPVNGATAVDINQKISLQFTEQILLSSNTTILLNNSKVNTSVSARTLTIETPTLNHNTNYTLIIPNNALSDLTGNFAKEIVLKFSTSDSIHIDGNVYEAEDANLSGDAAIASTTTGFTGSGYVNTNSGNVTFSVQTDQTGYYDLNLRYSSSSNKVNDLYVDGTKMTTLTFDAVGSWTSMAIGKLKLTAGTHTIAMVKNWGYIQLDNISLKYTGTTLETFNIAVSLVTPNPSAQAVNLYNFLKSNFGTNILSGTMANYSTNINEATWVYNQTGKYPALTCFDFINHTWLNQNWVEYSAPLTLGQSWWDNNGIIGFSWHWRDPLTKSGSFYVLSAATAPDIGTTFDISKVSDTNSAEYNAMIVDIDVIAGYLQQFKDANIPVIWRPLHEAEGGWFWWGAKGAESYKALWKLLFNRLVNYHGLNNLIWVWTSQADDAAANWYPGDDYVDVIGMDIYPGANQHGSQYLSFNKVKSLFGGKKIITLSECGSVPDPALMKEFGDTWSWFMPWNGDYTESDTHNGAIWWKKFFSYDYVITRDKMPNLK